MKEEFKEDMLFELYKDKIITCNAFKKEMKEKYKLKYPGDLYVRINNYQINKYGKQLLYESYPDSDTCKEICRKANVRKHTMKRYYKDRRTK